MAARGAGPRVAGHAVVLVPVLELGPRTAASEGPRSLSGVEVEIEQEQADGSPMGVVVETGFEEVLEGGRGPGARR